MFAFRSFCSICTLLLDCVGKEGITCKIKIAENSQVMIVALVFRNDDLVKNLLVRSGPDLDE